MSKNLLFASILCTFLPLIAVFILTPYISRKQSVFGVLLPKEAASSKEIKNICVSFSAFSVISGILFASVCYAKKSQIYIGISLAAYVLFCLIYYSLCNRLIKNIVSVNDYENLQNNISVYNIPKTNQKIFSIWWVLILLFPLIITVYITIKNPVSYSSYIPIIQTITFALVYVILRVVKKSEHFANKNNIIESIEKNVKFRRRWFIISLVSGFCILTTLLIMQAELLKLIQNVKYLSALPFLVTILVSGIIIGGAFKN